LLEQNYPNPFNPSTRIVYGVGSWEFVELRVFDVLGREVAVLANDVMEPGKHTVELDGTNLSSGVYLCRLSTPRRVLTRKLVLLR
jgi:hypothetical protein